MLSELGEHFINTYFVLVLSVFAATTLTAFHFTVTSAVGYLGAALGYVPQKSIPIWDLFLFSLVSNTSIVGMNLSLMLNSVGFYQVSEHIIEWISKKKFPPLMDVLLLPNSLLFD